MPRKLTRAELASGEVYFLLSIDWGGQVFCWSSRPCAPLDADGDPVVHVGGLPAISFTRTFSLLTRSPDTRQISLELDFGIDVAARVQQGHDLSAATGELAIWVDGLDYEDREVLLTGRISEPEYGADGDPVAFTLAQAPWDDRGIVPEATAVVNETTWPDAYSEDSGAVYPIVWGKPGVYTDSDGAIQERTGSPALVVDWDTGGAQSNMLLIAGHRVDSTSVRVVDQDGENGVDLTVTHQADGYGRICAVVDMTDPSAATLRLSTEYWVCWNQNKALIGDDSTAPIEGAGDLLMWMLRRSTIAMDYSRFELAAAQLNTYLTAGYIDEAVAPYSWLQDNLLPLLPVSLAAGPNGVQPVVWHMDATATSAVAELTEGAEVFRISNVSYLRSPSDLINDVRLDYALRARVGDYMRTVSVGPTTDTDAPDVYPLHHARVSASRYGVQSESIETDIVIDDATATAIATWMVRARALPIREVKYEGGADIGWIEPGYIVTLTDDDLSFAAQLCIVSEATWVDEMTVELSLLIVDEPARDL